jgi:hypothetical protein
MLARPPSCESVGCAAVTEVELAQYLWVKQTGIY